MKRWTSVKIILAIAAPMMIVACILISFSLLRMRKEVIADAQRANDTMAAVLSEQVHQSIQEVDTILGDIVEQLETLSAHDAEFNQRLATEEFHSALLIRLHDLPQAEVLTVVDSHGQIIASTRGWPTPKIDLSGRETFDYLKNHADATLRISTSQVAAATGSRLVYFTRRLESPDRTFLGIVSVGVRSDLFLRLYDGISNIPGSFVRLVRLDGKVVVSFPNPVDRDVQPSNAWFKIVAKGGGQLRTAGTARPSRLASLKPLETYPLVVDAGVYESNVLSLWRSRARVTALLQLTVALGVTTVVCVLFLLYRRSREAQARFNSVLSNMRVGIAMFDNEDRLVIHNGRFADLYGHRSDELAPGTSAAAIIDQRIVRGVYSLASRGEHRRRQTTQLMMESDSQVSEFERLSDGRTIMVSRRPLLTGGWLSTHEDVTERQQAVEKIAFMAHNDPLTGLSNRTHFLEQLGTSLQADAFVVVLILDLDEFKAVNDTFGHPVGDALLKAVAERLGEEVGQGDVVARLGGDEFAIIQRPDRPGIDPALDMATRLLARIREPFQVEEKSLKISLSIGLAVSVDPSTDSSTIMRNADFALYRAKVDGRNCMRLFDPTMAEEIQSRRDLAILLDAALERGQLSVHYQPIVDAVTRDVKAMEALVRWRDPTRGNIAPDVFIPLAEEAGWISRLGNFVLEQACKDALNWPSSVMASVNVSAIQVARGGLVAEVKRALSLSGLPAQRLQIEITESVLLGNDDNSITTLEELRASGIKIVLDDFGTGFSSLAYLSRFPLDKIKIDRSFIERLVTDVGSATIVAAVTNIARALNAVTTAEGVETEEQYMLLRSTHVDELQGYLFGRPMPAESWTFDGLKVCPRPAEHSDAVAA